ncbi:hypothetical protein [Kribbella pittospori]|uniref:hypothetical protein n=1 Tax=Kribbella pittospori TaxID=722689 RepID=UPI001EE0D6F8|nr:hypothetical protein [Kribbella pittospori]
MLRVWNISTSSGGRGASSPNGSNSSAKEVAKSAGHLPRRADHRARPAGADRGDERHIIVDGTLAELKQLLPPAKVEYVEKQPTLEDVFLTLVGTDK